MAAVHEDYFTMKPNTDHPAVVCFLIIVCCAWVGVMSAGFGRKNERKEWEQRLVKQGIAHWSVNPTNAEPFLVLHEPCKQP